MSIEISMEGAGNVRDSGEMGVLKKWIMENNYRGYLRFDFIAISNNKINHDQNIFQMDEYYF